MREKNYRVITIRDDGFKDVPMQPLHSSLSSSTLRYDGHDLILDDYEEEVFGEQGSGNCSTSTLLESETPLLPENSSELKGTKRLYWADCARIFSMLAIIFLHCSGYGCEKQLRKKENPQWIIVCLYNCLTRFGVPMFVLLSGTFILNPSKEFSFKKLFRHNILRLTTAFIFWSSVNAFLNIYLYKKNTLSEFFRLFFVGEEYLWFIFMIIGCYLIAPILRLFSDNVVISRYFLALCLFWGSFIPTLRNIFSAFKLKEARDELDTWTQRWHYHFTLEFVGYFVAGYHIVKHVTIQSPLIRLFLYLLALGDVAFYSYLTYRLEDQSFSGKYSKEFRDSYTITIVFYTIVLFIFFKQEIGRIKFSKCAIKLISKLSSLTFGVYLSHMIIKKLIIVYGNINPLHFRNYVHYSPALGCPILWVIITILSLKSLLFIFTFLLLFNYFKY